MKRIIKTAGQKPWPKTFINLRSTRRTELQDRFPSHVVDEWLGHSTKTAETHYLQVTEDHWSAGAVTETGMGENGGPTGGPISANLDESSGTTEPQKHEKSSARLNLTELSVTPTGLEPVLPA